MTTSECCSSHVSAPALYLASSGFSSWLDILFICLSMCMQQFWQ